MMDKNELFSFAIEKIIRTFLSLKAWGLVAITLISSYLVSKGYISGSEWSTTIISIYGMIYGIREYSKKNGNISFKRK